MSLMERGVSSTMPLLIASTFTDSLARLTGQEQKSVKTTAFDLQLDPTAPGLSMHRVERAKDPDFWSVRVNADIRIIVHKTGDSLLLAYVGHHDDAYAWAMRRRIERHPTTGAAQIVEVRERLEDLPRIPPQVLAPAEVRTAEVPRERYYPPLFTRLTDEQILSLGVPPDWLDDVRRASQEDVLDLVDHLPAEAMEALLEYAVTGVLRPTAVATANADPFSHPDAQRRFRVLENVEELERALEFPWEKWAVFLHPSQRSFAEREYGGPARISGSAGTGKTVVALHRAVILARRDPTARVLLTTFSKSLARALEIKLARLAGIETDLARRITVKPVSAVAYELYSRQSGQPMLASSSQIQAALTRAAQLVGDARFTPQFLLAEWSDVVDAWQLRSWEAYRDVARLGRKTRIGGKQREILWQVFERVREDLSGRKLMTWADLFGRVSAGLGGRPAFDHAVVDEAQDVGIAELRFLLAVVGDRPERLFFTGDMGQRIFQQPFSWRSLGVDLRGRSHTLTVNYRTSHQIRSRADRLLPAAVTDVDGLVEGRRGTVSVFNGPAPQVDIFEDEPAEAAAVGLWLRRLADTGVVPEEMAVIVRSPAQIGRARAAARAAGLDAAILDEKMELPPRHIALCPMHLAKGLEFRAVAVVACDDEVIPLQERVEQVADDSDLDEVYATERHLLYVAVTRARDHVLITGVEPESEFLRDLIG